MVEWLVSSSTRTIRRTNLDKAGGGIVESSIANSRRFNSRYSIQSYS
jgi:hypothetical protein